MSTGNSTTKSRKPETAERKAQKIEYRRKWSKTPQGIASRRKYQRSAKFRATQKRFALSPNGKALKARHCRRNGAKVKREALSIYSNGELRCACCGESNIGFLTLDHVNTDGAAHRRLFRNRGSGCSLAWRLRARGWPKDPPIQVLCYNCNCGRQYNGGICPHKGLIEKDASRCAIPNAKSGHKRDEYAPVKLFDN